MKHAFLGLAFSTIVVAACSGSEAEEEDAGVGAGGAASGTGGKAGTSGSGGSAGAGAGGASGKGGVAGSSGGAAGKAGSAGAAGLGGAAAGQGGAAGAAGKGGAGAAGKGGAGAGGCAVDADCASQLPLVAPAGCAVAVCDKQTAKCRFVAADQDGDGFATAKCKAGAAGVVIELGTDCDDTNKLVSPAGWDGPAGAGKPNACDDGVDQDCSGVPDDGKLPNGTTCTCSPSDVADCATDAGGKPIDFPGGKPVGLCKLGKKTCNAGGTWGPCIGAVAPAQETCDKQDNDCNGKVDDAPIDGVYWVYDGDDDGRGAKSCAKVYACKDDKPTAAPAGCGAGTCPTCAPGAWKLASAIPADDCDDNDASVNPLGKELCGDAKDSDCDGAPDNGCPCLNGQTQSCWTGTPGAVFEDEPGSKSTCKRGTQTCDLSGKWGECSGQTFPTGELCNGLDDNCDGAVDEGYDIGAVCNVKGSSVGACKAGGLRACGPGGVAVCVPNNPGIGENQFQTSPVPGSAYDYDWNCDGGTTYQYTSADWDIYPTTADGCGIQTICAQQLTQSTCTHQGFLLKPWLLNCDFHFNEPSPYCGNAALYTGGKCEWFNGKCQAPNLGTPLVQHTQGCY